MAYASQVGFLCGSFLNADLEEVVDVPPENVMLHII